MFPSDYFQTLNKNPGQLPLCKTSVSRGANQFCFSHTSKTLKKTLNNGNKLLTDIGTTLAISVIIPLGFVLDIRKTGCFVCCSYKRLVQKQYKTTKYIKTTDSM